jgi:hypothetical protein
MNTIIVNEENRLNNFPNLFGAEKFKNMPLFSYAERLFFAGMDQMVEEYSGGYFDYIEMTDADVELEKFGFIPLINTTENVELVNHFGTTQTLSFKAASMVVWLFVIEQIANNVSDTIQRRLFNTIQDIKYCYSDLTNEDGTKIFSKEDLKAIYKLLN